jgi:hypothetical protein
MPPTPCHGNDAPTIEPDHIRPVRHMTGRITMLGLSRWTGPGGSYRTVQRFCSTVIPWAMLFWVFFRQHVYCPQDVSPAIPSCGGMCHGQQSVTSTRPPTTAVTGAATALRAPASGVTPDALANNL